MYELSILSAVIMTEKNSEITGVFKGFLRSGWGIHHVRWHHQKSCVSSPWITAALYCLYFNKCTHKTLIPHAPMWGNHSQEWEILAGVLSKSFSSAAVFPSKVIITIRCSRGRWSHASRQMFACSSGLSMTKWKNQSRESTRSLSCVDKPGTAWNISLLSLQSHKIVWSRESKDYEG